MPLLLDAHRKAWAKLIGQTKQFRGTIKRFGHKHRQGNHIKRGATMVLTDVHQLHSKNQVDHVWIDFTPRLAQFGEHLRPHGMIQFTAQVGTYQKGGKNAIPYDGLQFDDLGLTKVSHVKIIKEPYWTKQYQPLMDQALIQYIIRTRQNVKSGLKVGCDPLGYLGSIYIGQGFCNRFAKTLSWRWSHKLPTRYR